MQYLSENEQPAKTLKPRKIDIQFQIIVPKRSKAAGKQLCCPQIQFQSREFLDFKQSRIQKVAQQAKRYRSSLKKRPSGSTKVQYFSKYILSANKQAKKRSQVQHDGKSIYSLSKQTQNIEKSHNESVLQKLYANNQIIQGSKLKKQGPVQQVFYNMEQNQKIKFTKLQQFLFQKRQRFNRKQVINQLPKKIVGLTERQNWIKTRKQTVNRQFNKQNASKSSFVQHYYEKSLMAFNKSSFKNKIYNKVIQSFERVKTQPWNQFSDRKVGSVRDF